MIYFYYGDDTYRIHERVNALKKKFRELYDPSGNNITIIHPDELTGERFNTAVTASGFLAKKKLIILKDIFNSKQLSDVQDNIIKFLKKQKNTADENYLIFTAEGVPRANSVLFTALKKICDSKCIEECEPLAGAKLRAWVQSRATVEGASIDPATAERLIMIVGTDTWQLSNEIIKLARYANGAPITTDMLAELASGTQVEPIFSFMDMIGSRNTQAGLANLQDHLASGTDPHYIIAMLTRQFRLIANAKAVSFRANNSYAIASALKVPPFVAEKIIAQSKQYSATDLEKIYGRLVKLDLQSKSDPENIGTALALFIASL